MFVFFFFTSKAFPRDVVCRYRFVMLKRFISTEAMCSLHTHTILCIMFSNNNDIICIVWRNVLLCVCIVCKVHVKKLAAMGMRKTCVVSSRKPFKVLKNEKKKTAKCFRFYETRDSRARKKNYISYKLYTYKLTIPIYSTQSTCRQHNLYILRISVQPRFLYFTPFFPTIFATLLHK